MVSSDISRRKLASKAQYDKHAQTPLMSLPLGSHVYAKARSSQRGSPWMYGQIIKSTSPRFYSIDTGNLKLRRNRDQLCLAAPPEKIPMQPAPHPLAQPSATVTPGFKPDQQPPAVPLHSEQPSTPPLTEQRQQDHQISGSSASPSHQQAIRSGRVVHQPREYKDFFLS